MSTAFRTPIPIPSYPFQISYQDQLMSMGSCFAEHIGERLQTLKFQHLLNPYGIVYHPLVLAELLQKLLHKQVPTSADIFLGQDLWRHYDFHSRYAHPDQTTTLLGLQQQFKGAQESLPSLNYLLITLGTAYGYQRQENDEWVNNCHKQPAASFRKVRADIPQIVEQLGASLRALKAVAPQLKVILTVSPVRHLRDGLLENQRSKAILLLAAEQLCLDHDFVHYFPAYEIVLDELRDYRFYATDMLHPSGQAIQYIWETFQAAYCSAETQALSKRIQKVMQASQHRPLHPSSATAQAFQKELAAKKRALEAEYEFLQF